MLVASALVLPAGLVLLAAAQGPVSLALAWIVLGVGMALGLYDTAFAALTAMYGHGARTPITGITLMAGFASTIGWPVSAWLDHAIGWRGACVAWAIVHLVVTLPCYLVAVPRRAMPATPGGGRPRARRGTALGVRVRGRRSCLDAMAAPLRDPARAPRPRSPQPRRRPARSPRARDS
ncbi:MAG: hypothetical protein IPF73_16510 [Betaproteobacteria bacterium]|nr:hypothetical protein [Betaproteobacteria bacterium]